jgi:hypothetical protein
MDSSSLKQYHSQRSFKRLFLRLWFADDHLLVVKSHFFSETYNRIYLKDIQSFLTIKTSYRKKLFLFFFLLLILSIILFLINTRFSISLAALLFSYALIGGLGNYFLGETCSCYIQTKVQVVKMPIVRMANSSKLIKKLQANMVNNQE